MSSVQSIAVILCCARADAMHVRPLAEHLRNKGIKVRLLEGIEEDAHLLGASLDHELGACMFVACLSDSLGAKDFRRLTGIYSARKGPQHYLADIMVEPDELPAMIESLDVALGRASKVVASGDRDKRANSRGPTRLRDVVGVTDISAVAAPKAPARSRKPKPKPEAEPRAPLREQSVAGSYVISARTGVGEGVARDAARAVAPSEQPVVEPKPVPTAASGSSSWMSVVLFLILVAVAGTVALVLSQDGDDRAGDRGVPRPAVISTPNDPPSPDADARAQPAQPEPAQPEPAQPEPAQPEPEPEVDVAAVIRESIAAGELRAIDLILIANADARTSWREAANSCRAKSHRGVRDWRLPSLEELKILRNARMLEPDRYWSSTLAPAVGDGSDHVFVLDVEARTLDPVSKDAADVRVLCVRAALP